ncbi:MAG: hypothetical protein ACE5J7_03750 [Candidatus Aenigmatarchaeota archaeon]
MKKNRMKGLFLGQCLDDIRWGSLTTVMYEMAPREMITFIQEWAKQNPEIDRKYHHFEDNNLELPYKNHKKCPIDENHVGRVMDLDGRIRCDSSVTKSARKRLISVIPAYEDKAEIVKLDILEHSDGLDYGPPLDPSEEDMKCYEKDWEKWKQKEKSWCRRNNIGWNEKVDYTETCYAIISDGGAVMSMEEMLKRLNVCEGRYKYYDKPGKCPCFEGEFPYMHCIGHRIMHEKLVFPFSGWTLAMYVESWAKQHERILFETPKTQPSKEYGEQRGDKLLASLIKKQGYVEVFNSILRKDVNVLASEASLDELNNDSDSNFVW